MMQNNPLNNYESPTTNPQSKVVTITAAFDPGGKWRTDRRTLDSIHQEALAYHSVWLEKRHAQDNVVPCPPTPNEQLAYLHAILGNVDEVHTRNTFVNLTEMFAIFGKTAANFLSQPRTKREIKYHAEKLGTRPEDMKYKIKGPRAATWGHQSLAVACAEDLSTDYYFWSREVLFGNAEKFGEDDPRSRVFGPGLVALLEAEGDCGSEDGQSPTDEENGRYLLSSVVYGWRGIPGLRFIWFVPCRETPVRDWHSIYPQCPDAHQASRAADQYLTRREAILLAAYLRAKGHCDIDIGAFDLLEARPTTPCFLGDVNEWKYLKLETQLDYPLGVRCWGLSAEMPFCPSLRLDVPKFQICTVSRKFTTRCAVSGEILKMEPIIAFHIEGEPERFVHPKYALPTSYACPSDMVELRELFAS